MQECWSGLPFLIPRGLPDPRIEYVPLMSPVLAGGFLLLRHLGNPVYVGSSFQLKQRMFKYSSLKCAFKDIHFLINIILALLPWIQFGIRI